MASTDERRNHPVQQHDLAARGDNVFVDPELSLWGHGELQQVGVVAALTQHHEHIGQFDVSD